MFSSTRIFSRKNVIKETEKAYAILIGRPFLSHVNMFEKMRTLNSFRMDTHVRHCLLDNRTWMKCSVSPFLQRPAHVIVGSMLCGFQWLLRFGKFSHSMRVHYSTEFVEIFDYEVLRCSKRDAVSGLNKTKELEEEEHNKAEMRKLTIDKISTTTPFIHIRTTHSIGQLHNLGIHFVFYSYCWFLEGETSRLRGN